MTIVLSGVTSGRINPAGKTTLGIWVFIIYVGYIPGGIRVSDICQTVDCVIFEGLFDSPGINS